jgi:hypothetical protein
MPAAKPAGAIPPERLASYERAVATLPGVERKGATVPYTSVNGNMFSYLGPTGTLALRLSSADRKHSSRGSTRPSTRRTGSSRRSI